MPFASSHAPTLINLRSVYTSSVGSASGIVLRNGKNDVLFAKQILFQDGTCVRIASLEIRYVLPSLGVTCYLGSRSTFQYVGAGLTLNYLFIFTHYFVSQYSIFFLTTCRLNQ